MSNQKPSTLLLLAVMVLPLILFSLTMPNDTYTQVRMQGPTPFINEAQKVLHTAHGYRNTGDVGFLKSFTSRHTHPNLHWGTKWDVYEVSEISVELLPSYAGFAASSILRCIWYTAWSPCTEGLLQISAAHGVDFTIKYLDELDGYTGFTTIIGGRINHQHQWSVDAVPAGIYHTFGFHFWFEHFFQSNYDFEHMQEMNEQEYLKPREKALCKSFITELLPQ